jgi:Uma2 family endonuclease
MIPLLVEIAPMATAARPPVPSEQREALLELPEEWVIRVPTSALTFAGFGRWCRTRAFPRFCKVSFIGNAVWITDWLGVDEAVVIPTSARTLEGFSDWADSAGFPRQGRLTYIDEEIIIDMSPEELQTHSLLKGEVSRVIGNLVHEGDMGLLFPDGARIRNKKGKVSNEPDCMFVSWEALESGRVKLVPRKKQPERYREVSGAPEWVLEIVSDSSVTKDTQQLRRGYFQAGIEEYWLLDARQDEIDFQMFRRGRRGFTAAPQRDGWQQSKVFGRAFRLERKQHSLGPWVYTLHVKL